MPILPVFWETAGLVLVETSNFHMGTPGAFPGIGRNFKTQAPDVREQIRKSSGEQ
jgi:hypothetical protein